MGDRSARFVHCGESLNCGRREVVREEPPDSAVDRQVLGGLTHRTAITAILLKGPPCCSPASFKLLRRSPPDAVKRRLHIIGCRRRRQAAYEPLQRLKKATECFEGENSHSRPVGGEVHGGNWQRVSHRILLLLLSVVEGTRSGTACRAPESKFTFRSGVERPGPPRAFWEVASQPAGGAHGAGQPVLAGSGAWLPQPSYQESPRPPSKSPPEVRAVPAGAATLSGARSS